MPTFFALQALEDRTDKQLLLQMYAGISLDVTDLYPPYYLDQIFDKFCKFKDTESKIREEQMRNAPRYGKK